jgi:putative transposase
MPGKAAKVVITERPHEILQRWVRSRSCPRGLAHRAQIILLAFDRLRNGLIAEQLGCERHAVGIGRRRRADAFAALVRIECLEGLSALETAIEDVLSDNPRSGCPGTFAPDPIARIIAVACEPPEDSGRPVTHRTPTASAEEVVARKIVPAVSVRHVGRVVNVPNSDPTGVGTGRAPTPRIPRPLPTKSGTCATATERLPLGGRAGFTRCAWTR